MSDTNERSVASAGSVAGEPVAWAVFCSGERLGVYNTERGANEVAYCSGSRAYAAPLYRQPQPTLTDAEREDLAMWRAECLRQCSAATEGGDDELAERWQGRARRAAAMLERLGGGK